MPTKPLNTCNWGGRTFNVWPLYQPLRDFSGVYIFTRDVNFFYYPIYIGQSHEVGSRIQAHLRDDHQIATYSNCVHCLTTNSASDRLQIERNLIAFYNPPLNVAHRTRSAGNLMAPDRWNHGFGWNLYG